VSSGPSLLAEAPCLTLRKRKENAIDAKLGEKILHHAKG
jgi:hypothetical protein